MPGEKPNQPNPNCPKCGRKSAGGTSGSITQWMIVCNCNWVAGSDATSDISFCATCGKRVSGGRAGSLTQWIFRSDLCKCLTPTLSPVAPIIAPEQIDEQIEAVNNLTFDERYQKIRELGFGGAGRVALYFDNLLKKQVAVKRSIELTAKQAIDFQNEARAVTRLKHPNIVDILDFGADDGRPYIVMSFIEGSSLDQYIEEHGPLPEDVAVPLFIKLLDALSHSHRIGILHRDIKSSNVILRDDANLLDVVLIDFGIASLIEPTQKPEQIAGTPAYMSPEQFSGKKYDERSEVYSIGCMLFEALTRQLPFQGETALQTISLHASATVPSLQQAGCNSSNVARLDLMIARALEKDPKDRYQSTAEMRDALSGLIESGDSQIQNSEPPLNENTEKPARSPYAIPLLITAALVLVPAFYWISTSNSAQEKPEPIVQPKPNSNISAFFSDETIVPRFEKSIGRNVTADLLKKVTEKVYALNYAAAGTNSEAKDKAEKELLAVQKLCKADSLENSYILTALAAYRRSCKRYPEALKLAKEAIKIYDKTPPSAAKLCEAYAEVGCSYHALNEKILAQRYFNRAVQLVSETPTRTNSQLFLMDISFQNAIDISDTKSAESIPAILESLAKARVATPEEVSQRMLNFAEIARSHKLYKIEEDLLTRASILLPQDWTKAKKFELFHDLSFSRWNLNQYRSALKAAQTAESYTEDEPGRRGSVAGLYNSIAFQFRRDGFIEEALKLHGRALRLCELGPGPNSGPTISTMIQLSDVQFIEGDRAKSAKLLRLADSKCRQNQNDNLSDMKEAIQVRYRQRGIATPHE